MSTTKTCREFRHQDGDKHICHRDDTHRGEHHADSGLTWGRNPHARRTRMADEPCPTVSLSRPLSRLCGAESHGDGRTAPGA
jgi:hypothetical protein